MGTSNLLFHIRNWATSLLFTPNRKRPFLLEVSRIVRDPPTALTICSWDDYREFAEYCHEREVLLVPSKKHVRGVRIGRHDFVPMDDIAGGTVRFHDTTDDALREILNDKL